MNRRLRLYRWYRNHLRRTRFAGLASLGIVVFLATSADSCSSTPSSAQSAGQNKSNGLQSQVYNPKNNIEFNNYNQRQKISDDPTTILWCTAYMTNPNVTPLTFPIVGKLTSSNKRPYPTQQVQTYYNDSGTYYPELPGPDGMYGASSEYRYGFTPGGVYVDFTNVETVCTTQPTVYQQTKTNIVLTLSDCLGAASAAASKQLAVGVAKGGVLSPTSQQAAEATLEQSLTNCTPTAPKP